MNLPLPKDIIGLLKAAALFAVKEKQELYLVGGFLRDALLKRENPDLDFCLKKGAIEFGRRLAKKTGCGYVILDREHGCCRLVKKTRDGNYTLDFTDFRGPDLEDDLLHRDFTVNAMAVKFDAALFGRKPDIQLIDPFGGKKDLKAKLIRLVNPDAFDEDPLRILRAFSLSCRFNFKIDLPTLRLTKSKSGKLSTVSSERIRDELFKILDTSRAHAALAEMDALKILKVVIPEIEPMRGVKQGPYHHLDIWKHSLEAVSQLEDLFQEMRRNKDLQAYCDEFMSSGRKRRPLLKLGVLLHDIGKPGALRHKDGKTIFHGHEHIGMRITREIGRRLKLSNDELSALEKMVMWHLRPGYLADNEVISSRAKFRYFRDTGNEALSILLLSMADQRATRGPLTSKVSWVQHERSCRNLVKEYFKLKKTKKAVPLINGDDLIKVFKLPSSPLIGKILREIEELQAIGKARTRAQALRSAKKLIP